MECVIRDRPFLNDQLVQELPAAASNSTSNGRRFTIFPDLPAELRLKIWKAAIEELQYRIFYVKLRPGHEASVMMMPPPFNDVEEDDSYRRGLDGYAAGLEAIERRRRLAWSTVFPTLLRVSRESRKAYLSVYRIPVPFGTGRGGARKLVVHLSPDRDVLDLNVPVPHGTVPMADDMLLRARLVVSFLCSLRARDPRGLGIRRLSLGAQVYSRHTSEIEVVVDDLLDNISPSVADECCEGGAAAFVQVLGNLASFFHVVKLGHSARCNPGYRTGEEDVRAHFSLSMPAAPGQRHVALAACGGCVSHKYIPSTPDVATFTWFGRDPRPHVAVDTRQLLSYECPPQLFRAWTEMEERFGVDRVGSSSSFRLYLAAGEEQSSSAFDRETARRHLGDEWRSWQTWSKDLQQDHGRWVTKMGNLMSTEQQAAVEDEALLAVGFWLWPSEALSRRGAEKPCNSRAHDDGGAVAHDLSGSLPGLLAVHLV